MFYLRQFINNNNRANKTNEDYFIDASKNKIQQNMDC